MATTTAASIAQPHSPETSTLRTMPRGTLTEAPMVSSAVCAEASNPVMVYAGNRNPSANSHGSPVVAGHTPPPAAPL